MHLIALICKYLTAHCYDLFFSTQIFPFILSEKPQIFSFYEAPEKIGGSEEI